MKAHAEGEVQLKGAGCAQLKQQETEFYHGNKVVRILRGWETRDEQRTTTDIRRRKRTTERKSVFLGFKQSDSGWPLSESFRSR